PVTALEAWQSVALTSRDGHRVSVTGVPAQHGPDGSLDLVGEVTGFALTAPDRPGVYISGDNASLKVVQTIHRRLGPFGRAILFAGAARTALAGGAPLTLTSAAAAEAVEILGGPPTVVLHFEGWAHFSEGADSLRAAFARRGLTDRLHLPRPGETIEL
ncbi:MAG TPA: hypothetical protein VE127_13310, partial [Solirubrobacteraceae bacterium]|nr:hypothetical protein [Solirubrobacteraceae bacterium]